MARPRKCCAARPLGVLARHTEQVPETAKVSNTGTDGRRNACNSRVAHGRTDMTSSANSSGSLQLPRRSSTVGANAIAQWLHDNGLEPELDGWNATIVLSAVLRDVPAHETSETTRFEIELEPERWTLCFRHGGLVSRIRVAELATVDGRDDHDLLVLTPQLRDLGQLLRRLEHRHAFRFHRDVAEVRSNHPPIEGAALRWLSRL